MAQNSQKFRLNASIVASYFKHRCDRLFRWNAVEAGLHQKPGIGWGIPAKKRSYSRPGIQLLMAEGDRFELENVLRLQQEGVVEGIAHPSNVLMGNVIEQGNRQIVDPIEFDLFRQELRKPIPPHYTAQLRICYANLPKLERDFLTNFGLDPNLVKIADLRPDLVETIWPEVSSDPILLRIWNFKASQSARHEHFIQVAYDSFLLEHMLQFQHLDPYQVDTSLGIIFTRKGVEEFDLNPYRLAVQDFLQNRIPRLFATTAVDAHYHVCDSCAMCEYMDHCQVEADAYKDLSG